MPEGMQTPTKEWGDLNQIAVLAEQVRGDRTALRKALHDLDEKLTPSLKGAGIEASYQAWSIQKYGGDSNYQTCWGIWYCPPDSDNNSGDPEDRYNMYPLQLIGDAPHTELMAFAESEGAALMRRYLAALQEKAPQIKADVEKMQRVLAALQPASWPELN